MGFDPEPIADSQQWSPTLDPSKQCFGPTAKVYTVLKISPRSAFGLDTLLHQYSMPLIGARGWHQHSQHCQQDTLHCYGEHTHIIAWVVLLQVSGEAIMRGLQSALENAPSALAARSVLEGFDIATRYHTTMLLAPLVVIEHTQNSLIE